jgi:molybdopterin synthase sulfur carrier subunit
MAVRVTIPHILRDLTEGADEVCVEADTVAQLLQELEERFPGVKRRICREDGSLHGFVNLYVNDEEVRFLNGLDTVLKDGDSVTILTMIAGG